MGYQKTHLILIAYNYLMYKKALLCITLITFLLAACGEINSLATPNLEENPTASPTDLQPDTEPKNSFIPYGKNIRFEQISLEEGLSQSVVNAILQDRQGFLWVGTDDGLNRYDGYNFKIYKPDIHNPNSISERDITAIVEDQQGYLWIGTQSGGLNRYDPVSGIFTHYLHNPDDDKSISSNRIQALCLDDKGLWIGTDEGLDFLSFENNIVTHLRNLSEPLSDKNTLSSNVITALLKDSNGNLWIGTANAGISLYDEAKGTFVNYKYDASNPNSLSSNRVLSLVENQNKEIWVGTINGLNLYNPLGNFFTRFTNSANNPNSLAGNSVFSLFVDSANGLWIGTNNGLDRYDPLTRKFIHHQNQPSFSNSLSSNKVYSIYEDASGILWIGTYGGGLNKYNRQQDRFGYYRNNPNDSTSLSSNFIFPILAESNNSIWIGTDGGGLNHFNPARGTFTRYLHNSNDSSTISSNTIYSLHVDQQGVLWVGTARGLDQFDSSNQTFTHYQPVGLGEEISSVSVSAIYEDTKNKLWVGTNQGLFIFNRNTSTFTIYNPYPNNPDTDITDKVSTLQEDTNQNLWIGTTDNGLLRINLESGSFTRYIHEPLEKNSLSNDIILSIYQATNGVVWIGTYGGGLNRYNPTTDSFDHFTENEGLPNNVIYGILEDEQGDLWLSTNFGLSRFNPANQTFRNFTVSDGLQSNEFNQYAFAKSEDDTMYFGGINGLNVFQPSEIIDNQFQPKISLTSFTLSGTPFNDENVTTEYLQTITLARPQDSFEFEFTTFAFEQPAKNQYAYMLEGFDEEWIQAGHQRSGRYTNLPGGTYTLHLRAANSDGVWSDQVRAIQIIVVPPYWETWWFRGLLVILLGIIIVGGLRWRVKNIENKNQELERLVRKRTADLEKRTVEMEALYQADEKILRSVTLNQIFQALVDVSVSLLNADRSVVFAWNESQQKIMPRVSRGFQPETLTTFKFERDEGMVGIAMNTSAAFIVSDIKSKSLRPDIQAAIQKEGIESFAHFPIVVDGKVVAIFNVAYTRPNALTRDSIRLFTALVNRASLSIANMDLFEQTKDLAVMEERNRLARDLHDSAKQKAFAALAQLGTVNGMAKNTQQEFTPHLSEAETLIYEVIQELNFLIQEIYPIALQEKGLETTLREYVFEWENRNDAIVNLKIQNGRELPLDTEQAVYRVIQEALANISRHSQAKRADVSLAYNHDILQVLVADDGCGFDTQQRAKGMGFRSMRERINGIRGTLQIQSAPGQGTRLIIQIPVKNHSGD